MDLPAVSEFCYIDGKRMERAAACSMLDVPCKIERAQKGLRCIVLATPEQKWCAAHVRHVSSCMRCLRLGFCEDVPAEMAAAAEAMGKVDHRFKPVCKL